MKVELLTEEETKKEMEVGQEPHWIPLKKDGVNWVYTNQVEKDQEAFQQEGDKNFFCLSTSLLYASLLVFM